jgi:thiamine pyrophosphate-dependent acetolactate synthase large subunit-like protein
VRRLVQGIAGYWHLVWIDGTYDIAGGRELEKYRRESAIAFGPVDTVKYAEAFGATGLMIRTADEIAPVLKGAFEIEEPLLIGVYADCRDNHVRLCVQKAASSDGCGCIDLLDFII